MSWGCVGKWSKRSEHLAGNQSPGSCVESLGGPSPSLVRGSCLHAGALLPTGSLPEVWGKWDVQEVLSGCQGT